MHFCITQWDQRRSQREQTAMPQPVHTCVTSLQAYKEIGVGTGMQILISFDVLCSSSETGLKVAGFRHWWYKAEAKKWKKEKWHGWTGKWQTFWQKEVLWVSVTHPGFWCPPYRGAKSIWMDFRFKSLEMVPTKQWTPMIASSWQEDKIWKSSDASRLHCCITEAGGVVQISLMVVPEWYIVPAEAADWPDRIEKNSR